MVYPRQPFSSSPRYRSPSPSKAQAAVYLDGENIGLHSEDFSLCASGIQFLSNTPVSQYKVVELTLNTALFTPLLTSLQKPSTTPPDCGEINCSCMVVDCCKNSDCGSYKISLYFIDLPQPLRDQISG